jgi:hypothetical protein
VLAVGSSTRAAVTAPPISSSTELGCALLVWCCASFWCCAAWSSPSPTPSCDVALSPAILDFTQAQTDRISLHNPYRIKNRKPKSCGVFLLLLPVLRAIPHRHKSPCICNSLPRYPPDQFARAPKAVLQEMPTNKNQNCEIVAPGGTPRSSADGRSSLQLRAGRGGGT